MDTKTLKAITVVTLNGTYYGHLAYWMIASKKEARYATIYGDTWSVAVVKEMPGMPIVPHHRGQIDEQDG